MPEPERKIDLAGLRKLGEEEVQEARPLVAREVVLRLIYIDPEGSRHEDSVISRVLNADERAGVARTAASMAGRPWDHFPISQQARIWALALCSWQLRDPPKWISDWIGVDDTLLMTLYGYLERHNSLFFGADDETGGTPSQRPRLVVTPQDPALADPK